MTMTNCHDGPAYGITPVQSTTGGACTLPETLLTSGTYQDRSGEYCTIYPDDYARVSRVGPYPYRYPWYPYPAVTTEMHTHVSAPSPEKPHEVVQRALREIAQAARALRDSAQAMGVPVEAAALEEAIVDRLRAAL